MSGAPPKSVYRGCHGSPGREKKAAAGPRPIGGGGGTGVRGASAVVSPHGSIAYCPYEPAPQWGTRLLAIRQKRLGWSQEQMAREIGINPSTLSRIEQNRGRLSRPVRRKLERFLGWKGKLLTGYTVGRP